MFYILAVEDNLEILDLIGFSLRTFPHDVICVRSGNHAIEIIKEKGSPEIIISGDKMEDSNGETLCRWLKEHNSEVPFVVCGSSTYEELKVRFPRACGHLQKSQIGMLLLEVVTSILAGPVSLLNYIPVNISVLLRFGIIDFDLYMQLSYANYVKVLNKGDTFVNSDAVRFSGKEVSHLYVTTPDASQLLKAIEKDLSKMIPQGPTKLDESVSITLESLELAEKLTSTMGWTPEIVETARKSISAGIKLISQEPQLRNLLKHKFKPGSVYARHVSLVSLICCCICQQLGWSSETTQLKLAIAALMHDLAVDDEVYLSLDHWNEIARNSKARDPETLKYRNHPVEAVTMLRNVQNLPEDIDLIIIQHHESGDGTGYPYNLSSGRISPMTAVLIIAEDLVNFIREDDLDSSIQDFLRQRTDKYRLDPFVKVFRMVKENVRA